MKRAPVLVVTRPSENAGELAQLFDVAAPPPSSALRKAEVAAASIAALASRARPALR